MLKSLSRYELKHTFSNRFEKICDFIEKANITFLKINGFVFRLELLIEKTINKRKKKDVIPVLLEDCNLRKKVINFFYNLCNDRNDDVMYAMKLCVNKSKVIE